MLEHILNENELNEAYDEIKSINEKISSLKDRKGEINNMLIQSAIGKAKAQFPGIEFGDKVKVVRHIWDRNAQGIIAAPIIGFMGEYFIDSRYVYGDFYDRTKELRLNLYQIKKDGTRSLKKEEIYVRNLVSIEKVEE